MPYSILSRLRRTTRVWTWYAVCAPLISPGNAHASFLQGEPTSSIGSCLAATIKLCQPPGLVSSRGVLRKIGFIFQRIDGVPEADAQS